MEYRELGRTGLRVSTLSFGAASLGTPQKEIDEATSRRTVHTALELGINLFDVSPYYGLTRAEQALGSALAESAVPRDRYILATKAGRYDKAEFDFSPERIARSAEESMRRLNTDYLDILQLHDVEFASLDEIAEVSLPALERMKQAGKIRFYGITGLPLKIFRDTLAVAALDTMLPYCHYALNDTTLTELRPLLEAQGVGLINASPLSMGLLSARGPMPWHPAGAEVKRVCREAAALCEARGANLAKLALQFALQPQWIPTTLVGTANPDNLTSNVRWMEEPIDRALLSDVLAVLEPIQGATWLSGRPENNDASRIRN